MPKNPSTAPSRIEKFSSLHDHIRTQHEYEMRKNQVVHEREVVSMKMFREHVHIPDERAIKSLQPRFQYSSSPVVHVPERPEILNTAFVEAPVADSSKKKDSSKVRRSRRHLKKRRSSRQRNSPSILVIDPKKLRYTNTGLPRIEQIESKCRIKKN